MPPANIEIRIIPPRANYVNRVPNLRRLYAAAVQQRPDVMICHELDSLLIGVLVKRRSGGILIFDSHEDHPLKAGVPIITTVHNRPCSRIVTWHNRGLVVDTEDVGSLCLAMGALINDVDLRVRLGRNGKLACQRLYNQPAMERRLMRLLRRTIRSMPA
jgi:glycosyltransferase involved in cell wall biosynthesis